MTISGICLREATETQWYSACRIHSLGVGEKSLRLFIVLGGLVISFGAFAQRAHFSRRDSAILRSQTPKIATPPSFTGLFEVRPTWGTRSGNFSTENYYEINWWVNPNQRITFGETFFTQPGPNKTQDLSLGDAFIRYQFREIIQNEKTGLKVSTEVRANIPLGVRSKEAGLVTALRSTILLKVPISSSTRFEFRETPIFYIYKEAGHRGANGPVSHPIFENRISLGPVISITENLTLVAPLNFSLIKFHNYQADAFHNNELFPDLSFVPELDWAITQAAYLGVSYRTEGLMVRDRAGMILSDSPGNGSWQLVFGINF